MLVTRTRLFVVGALLSACLAGAAWAHEDNVLDFENLEEYVAQQEAATVGGDKRIHKLWKSLDKTLGREARGKLAVDLGKLAALSNASNGRLASDTELRRMLVLVLDQADQRLAASPDDVAALIGQIREQKNRDSVLKAVIAARDLHTRGKTARDGGDEKGQIGLWKKAEAKFVAAKALANKSIKRQGGPLPQFKTAQAGRVYTVVGKGQGGFNGDGRAARSTTLYFVEECRIGPDGLLYILDWNNHKLRRRAADGTIEAVCGSGIPGDSEGAPGATDLNHPSSLVFEPTTGGALGKIYMAAWHNHKVKVYDPVGSTTGGPTVYTIAGTIQGGGGTTSGDGGLATVAKYNLLPGLVRLPNGDLLTADAGNSVIRRVSLNPGTTAPNLVGTQVHTGQVDLFAGTRGTPGASGDDGPVLSCTLNFSRAQNAEPDGRMELSPDGTKVFVICGNSNCIRVIDLSANPPTIARFAGTGTAGYAGDGGPAKDAQINRPSDIAVAVDGTVFFSDSYNNVIRKVAPDGTISTYAGSTTPGTAADDVAVAQVAFNHPAGLELDANGNLYVCDRENNVIRVITSANPGTVSLPVAPYEIPRANRGGPPAKGATGTIDTYAGVPPNAPGLASDEGFTPNLGFNGDLPARDTNLYWPQDVAVDPNLGLVHVVDWNNHRIRRIEQGGDFTTIVGSGRLGDAGGEGPDAKLNHPTDITFHPTTGELWIAAWHTDKVLRLDTTQPAATQLIYMAGNRRAFSGDGGVASNPITGSPTVGVAEMNLPVSVKFTANGDWFISDEGNQIIRKVDHATDIINTIAGTAPVGGVAQAGFAGDGGPALGAKFDMPIGQAAQPAGRICISPDERFLYICDTNNHRVRRIDLTAQPAPTIITVAGTGTAGYSGDGSLAIGAQLNFPCDVDCDAAGNIYIADRDNNAIRKVTASGGQISTVAGSRTSSLGTPTGIAGYSGDGGPATEAWLNRPCGIFVVRTGPTAGRIYVADTYNGIVRAIWE